MEINSVGEEVDAILCEAVLDISHVANVNGDITIAGNRKGHDAALCKYLNDLVS